MGFLHNELRRAGTIQAALKAALGVSEAEGGLERFGETLTPVLDLWRRPEHAFLRSELLWVARRTDPAVALKNSGVGINNPLGSGRIVVLTRVAVATEFVTTTNTEVWFGPSSAIFDASSNVVARDRRIATGFISVPQVIDRTTTDRGADGYLGPHFQQEAQNEGTDPVNADNPIVLPPGQLVMFFASSANVVITAGFAGYVRQAFRGELV